MCACRETDVRKSAEKFHPFYAAAVFLWWLNALYIAIIFELPAIYWTIQIVKEDEVGGVCSSNGGKEKCV
jgi:hypothetical protein